VISVYLENGQLECELALNQLNPLSILTSPRLCTLLQPTPMYGSIDHKKLADAFLENVEALLGGLEYLNDYDNVDFFDELASCFAEMYNHLSQSKPEEQGALVATSSAAQHIFATSGGSGQLNGKIRKSVETWKSKNSKRCDRLSECVRNGLLKDEGCESITTRWNCYLNELGAFLKDPMESCSRQGSSYLNRDSRDSLETEEKETTGTSIPSSLRSGFQDTDDGLD
jgi:hypothetical protein